MEGAIERPLILLECGGSGRLTTKMGAEMHGAQTCCAEIKTSPDVGSKAASAPLAEGIVMTSMFGSVCNRRRHDRQQKTEAVHRHALRNLSQKTTCAYSAEHACIRSKRTHIKKLRRKAVRRGIFRRRVGGSVGRRIHRPRDRQVDRQKEPEGMRTDKETTMGTEGKTYCNTPVDKQIRKQTIKQTEAQRDNRTDKRKYR